MTIALDRQSVRRRFLAASSQALDLGQAAREEHQLAAVVGQLGAANSRTAAGFEPILILCIASSRVTPAHTPPA